MFRAPQWVCLTAWLAGCGGGKFRTNGGREGEAEAEAEGEAEAESEGEAEAEAEAESEGETDPDCYTEPVDPDADLADLEDEFNGSNWLSISLEVLGRRWPAGGDLLDAMQDDPWLDAFVDASSFSALMESLMTMVHEETHGWDYENASWGSSFAYWIRADLTPDVPWIEGFPRSEILSMVEGDGTDLYDGTYLTGTQGTYNFMELLDEMNAYINGLGGLTFVADEWGGYGISARDGAVAFLYYLELYLKRARTQYPDLWDELQGQPAYVDLVRTQWLRTMFFLSYADAWDNLGISDSEIRANLHDADNEAEIEMFIGAEVDDTNCLP